MEYRKQTYRVNLEGVILSEEHDHYTINHKILMHYSNLNQELTANSKKVFSDLTNIKHLINNSLLLVLEYQREKCLP